MQTCNERVKLSIKKGRYVCPNCNCITNQKASAETSANRLILWCRNCKAEYLVNIEHGQCFLISRCR